MAILLDRRVDPGQQVNLDFVGTPLETALGELADARGQGWTLLDSVVYLGPADAARRLRTLAALRTDDVARAGRSVEQCFLARRPLRWDDFATPRETVADWARAAGVSVSGMERLPHDLWAGADLPSLSLVDRLTLVLVQFDLTFRIVDASGGFELVPVPSDVGLVARYNVGSKTAAWIARWSAALPGCRFKADGNAVLVKGLVEDHERIRDAGRRKPAAAKPAPRDLDAIRIQQLAVSDAPLSEVLAKVGGGLGLTWSIDQQRLRAAGISLDQRVSFQVENATVDQLLEALFAPVGLTYRRRGDVVEIAPK